jgi:HD-like signal output (HDOD) protein
VLQELRAAEKQKGGHYTKVIIISSKSDQDSLVKCVQAGCDDYIVKPFDKTTLEAKLKRLGFLHPSEDQPRLYSSPSKFNQIQKVDLGVHLFKLLQQGKLSLPSQPDIFIEFRKLLSRQASGAEMADLLKQDASVSFKLISVSNSPQYKGVSENTTVEQAIGRLGMAATRKYVYLICGRAMYSVLSRHYDEMIKEVWRQSVVCAHACEVLSESLDLKAGVDPFTLGILHDIGKLALIQFVDKLEQNQTLPSQIDEEELSGTLNLHHGRFGEALLKRWGFSKDFTQVARLHPNPP